MIDTAIPDTVADGLINFDKRRKEFEVLAQVRTKQQQKSIKPLGLFDTTPPPPCIQIKLLQGAANSYNFETDQRFDRWFESLTVLDEREAYELSCAIEPCNSGVTTTTSARNSEKFRRKTAPGHKKNDSIASTSSSSSSQFLSELDGAATSSLGDTTSLEQKIFHVRENVFFLWTRMINDISILLYRRIYRLRRVARLYRHWMCP